MVDETKEPISFRLIGRSIRVSGNASLGNLLIMVGMLAGGASTVFVVGTSAQRIQDAVYHELEIRSQSVTDLSAKISDLAAQETRDVADIKLGMSDIRADLRNLIAINPTVIQRR